MPFRVFVKLTSLDVNAVEQTSFPLNGNINQGEAKMGKEMKAQQCVLVLLPDFHQKCCWLYFRSTLMSYMRAVRKKTNNIHC